MKLMGIKHKFSMSFHPQTNSSSEQTNKMVIQCLQYHVEHNQKGWAKALPKVHFDIMNTMNASTGFSPFILKTGHSPQLLPPLISITPPSSEAMLNEEERAGAVLAEIKSSVQGAQDTMLAAKLSQAHHANSHHTLDPKFVIGDQVMLVTTHCC